MVVVNGGCSRKTIAEPPQYHMFVFIVSRDWRNIYLNNLESFKAKLLRDGFNLEKDRFFIVSANKRYLGYKKINEQFSVFYLICPQILMPMFMALASLIFFSGAVTEKPDICYATTPFFALAFWPCKYFLGLPLFCNYVSSVSDIIKQKGGIKRKVTAKAVGICEFLGAKMADILMPNSQWLKQKLLAWKISPSRIIFRPVRPPELKINPARIEELRKIYKLAGKKIIFTASRLEKEKNLGLMFEALAKIKRSNVVWLLAGAGSQEAALKNMAEELGLGGMVIFLGYVDHSDIWLYYDLCSVFALPSLSEGMPTVVLEAMLMKKAVIASDIPGNELVIDGQTGLLINPLSVVDLAEKINLLLDDEDLKKRLAQKGNENALAYLQQYKGLEQIYQYYLSKL